ncbi:Sec-independent protein translocase protein TatC [bioreactor metagenome]|uniref:Sec-independent protein translocase protein TatC n=1 Tax=bioreactor metagenome TaxID=1076179 RepID=A0A645C9V9_9ZZZZ
MIGISDFVNLAGLLALSFGIMFQLPIAMVLLMRCGIVAPETLRKSRPVAVTAIFILAAILTPPDVVSQLLLGVPTWLLFEAALLIGAGSSRRKPAAAEETEPESGEEKTEAPPPPPPEDPPESDPENTLDAVYRRSDRKNMHKNRRFGTISDHYHRSRRKGK